MIRIYNNAWLHNQYVILMNWQILEPSNIYAFEVTLILVTIKFFMKLYKMITSPSELMDFQQKILQFFLENDRSYMLDKPIDFSYKNTFLKPVL